MHLLAEQPIQISFEMLCGAVAFIIVVVAGPSIGFLWKISNKVSTMCVRLSHMDERDIAQTNRLDCHETQLDDHHDRLLKLGYSPKSRRRA